jgi:glutamate/tyrosine decarboxylase-like PLP-dependent enzyme
MEGARHAPLAVAPEEFRAAGYALVDRIAELLAGMRERPVAPGLTPDAVRAALGADGGLPDEGTALAPLLEEATELLVEHSTFNGHPRFFGYITSSPAPVGMLADLLAAAVNPNVGGWSLAPMATEIEARTVRWIAGMIGYPTDGGGLLVSGGNMANFVGFAAARVAAAGEEVRSRGLHQEAGAGALRVYGSAETHTWIEKAADLHGLGTDSVRWIETDEAFRLRPDALARAIRADRERGDRPMMVVGTAGSTAVGAVDPLGELADLCREEEVWLHVDAAYGGFAAGLPGTPPALEALGRADSVAVDPHKWLYAPLEAGCALVRDPGLLRRAFSYHPPYYHFGFEATNYVDHGPQNSRGFRALKVWLALRQAGRRGYRAMIAEDLRLAEVLHEAAARHPEIEAGTRGLSVVTFRYRPPGWGESGTGTVARMGVAGGPGPSSGRGGAPLPPRAHPAVGARLDRLQEALLDRLERSGDAFLSKAVLDGRVWLRACIVNFRTEREDVEALPEIVAHHGRALVGEETGGPAGSWGPRR